jgi:CIC family chloride channel protein
VDAAHKHYARAAVVGVFAGLVGVLFQWALTAAERGRVALLDWLHARPHAALWGWAVLPAVGLLAASAAGLLVTRLAPDAAGSGIPHIKGVLVHIRRLRWARVIPVKFVGGVLCVGAGMSMGREGPTVQMGAGVGRAIGDALKVPRATLPQLVSSGAGAGVASAFNAPLAGFLFVLEELHREFSALTFGGALIAAVAADVVARSFNGSLPSFAIKGSPALPLELLPLAALLGLAGGALGVAFNAALLWSGERAASLRRVPRWLQPGLGAALCGLVAWWLPQAVGGGHLVAHDLLSGALGFSTLMLGVLLAAKFALTVLSYATGAPGGIFAPMLLIGAVLGAIAADLATLGHPAWNGRLGVLAILGMAAMFVGSVRAPLTGIVLITEMTAGYEHLLPLCLTAIAAHLAAEQLRGQPLYEALLEQDIRRRGLNPDGPADPAGAAHLDHHRGLDPRSVVMGVQRQSALDGKAIRDAGLPAGCLVVAIERAGRELLPTADRVLAPGDHITVLVPAEEPEKALRVVELARAG